jgi:hypothetical protein
MFPKRLWCHVAQVRLLSAFSRFIGFLMTTAISSVIPADLIYADPELRTMLQQDQVSIPLDPQ